MRMVSKAPNCSLSAHIHPIFCLRHGFFPSRPMLDFPPKPLTLQCMMPITIIFKKYTQDEAVASRKGLRDALDIEGDPRPSVFVCWSEAARLTYSSLYASSVVYLSLASPSSEYEVLLESDWSDLLPRDLPTMVPSPLRHPFGIAWTDGLGRRLSRWW